MNTLFLLMSEFETGDIPLTKCCEKYFGLKEDKAKRQAARDMLPVPCYKGGSQKSTWLIDIKVLADHLDKQKEEAKKKWELFNM